MNGWRRGVAWLMLAVIVTLMLPMPACADWISYNGTVSTAMHGESPDPWRHPTLTIDLWHAARFEAHLQGVGEKRMTRVADLGPYNTDEYAPRVQQYLNAGYTLWVSVGPVAVPVSHGLYWSGLIWYGKTPRGDLVLGFAGEPTTHAHAAAQAASTPRSEALAQQTHDMAAHAVTIALAALALTGATFVHEGLSIMAGQPVAGAFVVGVGLTMIGIASGTAIALNAVQTPQQAQDAISGGAATTASGPVGPGSSSDGVPGAADNSPGAGPGPGTGDGGAGDY